jgi:hypothetical protein
VLRGRECPVYERHRVRWQIVNHERAFIGSYEVRRLL